MPLFEDTFAPYVPFGSRDLTVGKAGTDVAVVQAVYNLMLRTMNPPSGPIGAPIAITGRYDPATVQAVRAIQQYFGLEVDGVVGPQTYFVFGQGVGPNTTYGGPVYGSRSLQQGDTGGDVTILQNRLNTFRYAPLIGHPANGFFDAGTAKAVLAFKQDAQDNGDVGFPANGIAGDGFFDASWLYTFAGGRAILTGRNGFDVVFVQVVLRNLGLYCGPVHGLYDTATRFAVEAFQRSHDLTVDGVVGPATFHAIGRSNNLAAPLPLSVAWPAPSPQVSVCCVALTSATADLHPYGVASHVVNDREGFESLDVVGHQLPNPEAPYDAYSFSLTDPATGQVVVTQRMSALSPGDWAGTYSPGVKSIPKGPVRVFPSSSGGAAGSPVLQGDLANCHRAASFSKGTAW